MFISVASSGLWKYRISTLALKCLFGKGRPSHYKIPDTPGKRHGTREYVMRRFPYIIVFKVQPEKIYVLRVLHQAMRYFN
jgi:hypothetical protein